MLILKLNVFTGSNDVLRFVFPFVSKSIIFCSGITAQVIASNTNLFSGFIHHHNFQYNYFLTESASSVKHLN